MKVGFTLLVLIFSINAMNQLTDADIGTSNSINAGLVDNSDLETNDVQTTLQGALNQETTLAILFNVTVVGSMLQNLTSATFLAPDDSAWENLFSETDGDISDLLNGPTGNLVLERLLKYHIVEGYYLYSDFQVHCLDFHQKCSSLY